MIPPDLQENIYDEDRVKDTRSGGILLHFVSPTATDFPMHLIRLNRSVFKLHRNVWPVKFHYGLDKQFLKENVRPNSEINKSRASDFSCCSACGKKDVDVLLDLECLHCMKPCHPTCCRKMDHEDIDVAKWLLGKHTTHNQLRPAVVVCRKCDGERLAPNQCSCRVHSHFNETKQEVGVLRKKPSVHLFGGDVVKCMKCRNPCHAVCAKWLPDRRRKSPFHRMPYCLGCEHKASKDALSEKNIRAQIREIKRLVDLRTKDNMFHPGDRVSNVVLGEPFSVPEIDEMVEESVEEFNRVRRKVPPVNLVQLCKFMNPEIS